MKLPGILTISCLLFTCVRMEAAPPAAKTKTFKGAWFAVSCPADFKARLGMKSLTSSEGCDSAFFTSPDKQVEFYVFSPQWNGEPKDYALDPNKEVVVNKKEKI